MSPPHRAIIADAQVSATRPVVPVAVASGGKAMQLAVAVVRAELASSPYAALRQVRCTLEGDVLTLSGRVPSFYLKQMAQRSAIDEPAIEKIVNLIEVTVS